MAAGRVLTLTLRGDAVTPETLPIEELGALLQELGKGIRALGAANADFGLALAELHHGSINLAFATDDLDRASAPVLRYATALQKRALAGLPEPTQKSMRHIRNICKKKSMTATLGAMPAPDMVVVVDSHFEFEDDPSRIRGQTTLYGILRRAGGAKPALELHMEGGARVTCEATKEFVLACADRLYSPVGIEGTAWYEPDELKMVRFKAHRLLPYRRAPMSEGLRAIADMAGDTDWTQAANPGQLAKELRHGGAE